MYKHKIFKCSLQEENQTEAEVIVGAPMDNDCNNVNRIIDGNTFMDWDKPRKGNRGFFRYYMDKGGINCHAPFQLSVPKYVKMSNLVLKIEVEADSREKIFVEQFVEDHYERIGIIDNSKGIFEFKIVADSTTEPKQKVEETGEINGEKNQTQVDNQSEEVSVDENKNKYEEMLEKNSIYGSQEIIIEKVDLIDSRGMSKRVFTMGESMTFKIQLNPQKTIPRFTMVVDIMNKSGKVVNQVFCESEDLGITGLDRAIEICANYNPLRFGEDEYMVSIGVFKYCDYASESENESYCVADRAVFFNLKQADSVKKSMGAFAHPCEWTCMEKKKVFDAAQIGR